WSSSSDIDPPRLRSAAWRRRPERSEDQSGKRDRCSIRRRRERRRGTQSSFAITPPSARRVTSLTVAARASVVKREYGERGRNEPPRRRVPRRLDHRGFPVLALPPP